MYDLRFNKAAAPNVPELKTLLRSNEGQTEFSVSPLVA
jgi:hypothetical protein